ncbi:hypothetical protein BJF78_25695 [Pseudonocardia sp. CNS-139]|nr:hypothetical protein BJF78_25695 [Pseudonocardia sp. CNS-139]
MPILAAPARLLAARAVDGWWKRVLLLVPLAVVVVVCVWGPSVIPFDPVRVITRPGLTPGGAHLFGTDTAGMDVFSRTVVATRTNVVIAGLVALGPPRSGSPSGWSPA